MTRKEFINSDIDTEIIDTFGEFDDDVQVAGHDEECEVTPIHSEHWTIVDAFNAINEELPMSELGKQLFIRCAEAFSFLSDKLGLNAIQCVVIAMLVEKGGSMTLGSMGVQIGISRLSMMTHCDDIEELFRRHWIRHRGGGDSDGMCEKYALAKGVVKAIRENRCFEPEVLECRDTQEFVEKMSNHIESGYEDDKLMFSDEKVWLQDIVNANKTLPICKTALGLGDVDSMCLLMLIVADYCNYNGSEEEGIGPHEVQLVYPSATTRNFRQLVRQMQDGTHRLFREGLMEHKCVDGMANVNTYMATAMLKEEILSDFVPEDHAVKKMPRMSGLKSWKSIAAKALFYNASEGEQIGRLENLLSQEQLPQIQARLKEKGMRTGVCVLLHGSPGTGKTATAYELARKTGRDIIEVNVTDFKDKYVGESERRLKQLFAKYRDCCRNSEVTPLLLLNEGDAILSKRLTNVEHNVDQTANALQNILLEEMENLEGVMIVTTNMIMNLDDAFERRFLFKIQFEKPGREVKAHIWKSMIDGLDDKDSMELADLYDMSGGEIENIARKATMEYVLTGKEPDADMVKAFAKNEKLTKNHRAVVGF